MIADAGTEQDHIDSLASEWVVRAGEPDFNAEDHRALAAWRAADPRHEASWASLSRTWGEIPQLALRPGLAPGETRIDQRPGRRVVGPLAALAAAAAAFALVFVAPSRQTAVEYSTELAEMRLLTLPDGSQVTLGPKSNLTVRFGDGQRRVALTGGEAFFEVVPDPDRTFLVDAGQSQIRVVGTKFDVSHGGGSLRVAVLEGLVQVRDPRPRVQAGTSRVQWLRAGQRAELLPPRAGASATQSATTPVSVSGVSAPAPGSWREGRLVYENARLADLVADINRYYAPGVTLADPGAGELRVTASFKASEIPMFMSAVGNVVPVEIRNRGNGAFELRSANH